LHIELPEKQQAKMDGQKNYSNLLWLNSLQTIQQCDWTPFPQDGVLHSKAQN
jgi:hypothetical protein